MGGTIGTSSLPEVLLELTDTLGPEFDTAGLLLHLVAVSVDLLDVEASGVLLLDEHGRLVQVAATHSSAEHLEQVQARFDSGPCLDAVRTDQAVVVPDLEQEGYRWPDFSHHASHEGFRAVHAVPLSLRGAVVGGLNLFRQATGFLNEIDQQTARHLATAAATGLLHRRAVHQLETTNEQLQQALESRVIIEQAKGFLAAQNDLSPDVAFTLLRSHARSRQQRLTVVARAVVDGDALIP